MKIRTRLYIAIVALITLALYVAMYWIVGDLRPRYLATMEESMVDSVTVLASLLEGQLRGKLVETGSLEEAFERANRKELAATIYEFTKTSMNMRAYVTDQHGIVLYDSDGGKDEGKDYSNWNDVRRTLSGQYGARATLSNPGDPRTTIMHVAAPIRAGEEIVGVITIAKPAHSVETFVTTAYRNIVAAVLVSAIGAGVLAWVVSMWISRPIERLTRYANDVRDGKRAPTPRLRNDEIGALGRAFEEMRTTLEGKRYIEEYIQSLTHQMKSPLSAIRGAAELLIEDMPPDQRQRFLENICAETARIQELIDRMLQLAAIENRTSLRDVAEIDFASLLHEVLEDLRPLLERKRIEVSRTLEAVSAPGERFLLRQAILNLLQNAVDFSAAGAGIVVALESRGEGVVIRVCDSGPGIPDYALPKIFGRFYSLSRPDSGKKSSGLGLTFAKEVAELHGGEVRVSNRPGGGVEAVLEIPVKHALTSDSGH